MSYVREDFSRSLKYVREEMEYLFDRLYEHEKGHLPSNLTPGQLSNAIDVLGLSDDYQVQPRFLYASKAAYGSLECEYVPKK